MDYDFRQIMFSVGRWCAQGILGLAALTFFIQWFVPRIRKWLLTHSTQTASSMSGVSTNANNELLRKQETIKDRLQKEHLAKDSVGLKLRVPHQSKPDVVPAESYKERILDPREDLKKQKKEDEYYRFMGPAWKGAGYPLGKDQNRENTKEMESEETTPGKAAARQRRIQEPTPQPFSHRPPKKEKRVIKLPEEPTEGADDSILVILRSPVHTCYQRRFRQTDSVQVLLDFMTMSGFSQKFNTLCTSFPRRDISHDRAVTLQQLNFHKRVILNIEELEL